MASTATEEGQGGSIKLSGTSSFLASKVQTADDTASLVVALNIHEKRNAGFSNGFCDAKNTTEKYGAQRSDGDERRGWDCCLAL